MTDHPTRRNTLRLRDFDYRTPGYYFVTIGTYQHLPIFGEVRNARMHLNPLGEIVKECWLLIPQTTGFIELDQFVIMPNHLHGIVYIMDSAPEIQVEPLPTAHAQANSLSVVIRTFKAGVTRIANQQWQEPPAKIWQRSFYDHIIRNEESLQAVRYYIANNPLVWWQKRQECG
jgi:putative transposase